VRTIGKMKDTLMGCASGILIANGADGTAIAEIKKVALDVGATAKIVAPHVGGATLADGTWLAADGQVASTPSVLFDAVAVILSHEGAGNPAEEPAAIDFVGDALGPLKAIAADSGGHALLTVASTRQDADVVDAHDRVAFIAAAKTRQWEREKAVRTWA
jgi:catalase